MMCSIWSRLSWVPVGHPSRQHTWRWEAGVAKADWEVTRDGGHWNECDILPRDVQREEDQRWNLRDTNTCGWAWREVGTKESPKQQCLANQGRKGFEIGVGIMSKALGNRERTRKRKSEGILGISKL